MLATSFSNHVNVLVDRHIQWNPDRAPAVSTLQEIALSALYESIKQPGFSAQSLQSLQSLPIGIQETISLEAPTFKDWVILKNLNTEEVTQRLLKRFSFSRNFLERGTETEILLRRTFEATIRQATDQEKAEIIAHKRKLSVIDYSVYSSLNIIEKVQKIVGKMIGSKVAKIALTLLMIATTVLALRVLHIVGPHTPSELIDLYFHAVMRIIVAFDDTQSYCYYSLVISMLSGFTGYFTTQRRPDLSVKCLALSAVCGLHWFFSELATLTRTSLSKVIFALIKYTRLGPIILIPFLIPLICPAVIAILMLYTADSSTSIASRVLNTTSAQLSAWRMNKELFEACDLWIKSIQENSAIPSNS